MFRLRGAGLGETKRGEGERVQALQYEVRLKKDIPKHRGPLHYCTSLKYNHFVYRAPKQRPSWKLPSALVAAAEMFVSPIEIAFAVGVEQIKRDYHES